MFLMIAMMEVKLQDKWYWMVDWQQNLQPPQKTDLFLQDAIVTGKQIGRAHV